MNVKATYYTQLLLFRQMGEHNRLMKNVGKKVGHATCAGYSQKKLTSSFKLTSIVVPNFSQLIFNINPNVF